VLATRLEAPDPAAPMLSVAPVILTYFQVNQLLNAQVQALGCSSYNGPPWCVGVFEFTPNTVFKVSGQAKNVRTLPFIADFSTATMLMGQNVSVFTNGIVNARSIETASTLVLTPQTIDGGVMQAVASNGLSVYTVVMAPYDLIPTLQQASFGTINRVTNPTNVYVYVDGDSKVLTSRPVAVGDVLRFRGLIFDDSGTLRMDCLQVNDGVPM